MKVWLRCPMCLASNWVEPEAWFIDNRPALLCPGCRVAAMGYDRMEPVIFVPIDERKCSNWELLCRMEDWHIIDEMVRVLTKEMKEQGKLVVEAERPWLF